MFVLPSFLMCRQSIQINQREIRKKISYIFNTYSESIQTLAHIRPFVFLCSCRYAIRKDATTNIKEIDDLSHYLKI